jgi:hypothetical protein
MWKNSVTVIYAVKPALRGHPLGERKSGFMPVAKIDTACKSNISIFAKIYGRLLSL